MVDREAEGSDSLEVCIKAELGFTNILISVNRASC